MRTFAGNTVGACSVHQAPPTEPGLEASLQVKFFFVQSFAKQTFSTMNLFVVGDFSLTSCITIERLVLN